MANQPLNWNFGGTTYDSAEAHQGQSGLWYVRVRVGTGRFIDKWELLVFPRHAHFSSRQRTGAPDHVLPMPLLLLRVSGSGGYDSGKGYMSKGGYRAPHDVPYDYKGVKLDGSLLNNGDEFLRQVMKYEPSVEGIKAGIIRDEEAARQVKLAEEERHRQWEENYKAEQAEYVRQKQAMEKLFGQPTMPEGWVFSITSKGMEVWKPWPHFDGKLEPHTFATLEAYQKWYDDEVVRQAVKAEEDKKLAEKHAEEEKARQAEEARQAALREEMKKKIPGAKKRLQDL